MVIQNYIQRWDTRL